MKSGMKQTIIGEIPADWSVCLLGENATIRGRIGWKGLKQSEYITDGPYMIAGKHVANGSIKWEKCDHIPEARYNESLEIALKEGDLVFSKDGSLGNPALIRFLPGKATINSTMMLVRINGGIQPEFFYQILCSPYFKELIRERTSGSSIPHIFQKDMNGFKFPLPPLPEQRKIAGILSTVDEKMAVIDEQLAQTQELKKGLMQRLLTKGIGHTAFKDSPLGEIPEGWNVVKLGELGKVERGKFQQRPRNDPRFYGGQYPFVQTGDVVRANGKLTSYSQSLNELGLSVSRLFPIGTIIITIAANIGDVAIAQLDVAFPDSLVGIVVNEAKVDNTFLMYYLVTQKEALNKLAPQSAQKNINLETLKPYLVPVPSLPEQRQIAEILTTVDDKLQVLTDKKAQYQELKRGLMQQLLTGQRRVRVAQPEEALS